MGPQRLALIHWWALLTHHAGHEYIDLPNAVAPTHSVPQEAGLPGSPPPLAAPRHSQHQERMTRAPEWIGLKWQAKPLSVSANRAVLNLPG